ncbi:hypothetical protein V3331_18055 [Gaopeijia maritima]|uniref:hypothetical protein n=1 Tax=Gaopeijia maritima TaxID=3119007 RepID=UPI0032501A19
MTNPTNPPLPRRLGITLSLSAMGAVVGAAAGVALTVAGNLISGYNVTPGLGVYLWNSGWFAALGAAAAPLATWTSMRAVPIWKAVTAPPITGLLTGLAAFALVPSASFVAAVGGVAAAVIALRRSHPPQGSPPALRPPQ